MPRPRPAPTAARTRTPARTQMRTSTPPPAPTAAKATPALPAEARAAAAATPAATPASASTAPLRSVCPVACSLDVLGDRWSLLVVRDLLAGKRRFGDFLASPEHIPTNILADRLKRLERAGLIARSAYSERPRRYEYALTPSGRDLEPVVDAIATWGLAQFPGTRRGLSRRPGAPA